MRKKIKSNKQRLRLSVFRSNKHIYAQIIDDEKGCTVVSASSITLKGNNLEVAQKVGVMLADKAIESKIDTLVFDRGNYPYTGKIKALADSVRNKGLSF
ncbi:MAG: 50S ribosomal protein L18 [Candidatus Margulisiibacteriota bacterium]|jgi:large subunit ribosomal protein L18